MFLSIADTGLTMKGMTCRVRKEKERRWARPAWRAASCVAGCALLTFGCSPAQRTTKSAANEGSASEQAAPSALSQGRAAMKRGDFARAQTHFQAARGQEKAQAKLALGELLLLTGRYDEAILELEATPTAFADLIVAEALRRQGKLSEAMSRLEKERPEAPLPLRLARSTRLGELLLEQGQRDAAQELLLSTIDVANRGKLDKLPVAERARAWGWVGRSAHLLRSPEDANDAFNQSESLASADLDLLLARAQLFIEKFDFAHAEEVLRDAKELAPHHPEVRLLAAHLALKASLAFAEVEEIAREVLTVNPKSSGARFLLAGVALRDLNIKKADEHLRAGLSTNPRDLDLLSMKAAVRFLAEDPKEFESIVSHVQTLSPGYTGIFHVVTEYAEWEHRYPDMEKLLRRAVRLDREDGLARSLLGLTLVRSGSDAAGVVELRQAFELDPYNVRVLNTLNLYEKTIPEDYIEKREGPFSFRFPKAEAALLERYVPALLKDAHAQMVERYGYEPPAPIGIEIYESMNQFAVRTSGLPQTAIAGVCFGRKLATMSPIASPGNLGMTLWHELAHVFHIGQSENRVPRWLTEGLAEWETERRDVGWSREMDLELYRALRDQSLPKLGAMSRAFTHARRLSDVANAYYASGKIASYIATTHGEQMIPQLLEEFGKKKLPEDVVPVLLGASYESLNQSFRASVSRDLKRFETQFVSEEPLLDRAQVHSALKANPKDRTARFHKALLELADGNVKEADARFARLLDEKFDPQVAYAHARILMAQEKKKEALALLEEMIEKKHDGLQVRMVLGRLHLASADHDAAVSHLRKATTFDPLAEEPWSLLASLHHGAGDTEEELVALRKWANLSEHDPLVHRRLLALLIETEHYEEATKVGELAIWADLAGFETHRLYGLALARRGDLKAAEVEFESALLCPASPTDLMNLEQSWSEELRRLGQPARAAQVAARIAKSPRFGPLLETPAD